MKCNFVQILLCLCLSGLGATAIPLLVCSARSAIADCIRTVANHLRTHGLAALTVPTIFFAAIYLHGSSKPSLPKNASPAVGNQPAQTVAKPASDMNAPLVRNSLETTALQSPFVQPPALIGKWWRRGGSDDGQIIRIPDGSDWRFPWQGDHLSRFEIWASGTVYPSEKANDPIARLPTVLLLKAHSTQVILKKAVATRLVRRHQRQSEVWNAANPDYSSESIIWRPINGGCNRWTSG